MGLRDYPDIKSKAGKDVYCFFFTGLFYAVMGHPGPRRKKFLAKITDTQSRKEKPISSSTAKPNNKNPAWFCAARDNFFM